MESKRTLIFFPEHALHRSGLLIGYNLKRFYICITAVLQSPVPRLSAILDHQTFASFNQEASAKLQILGEIIGDDETPTEVDSQIWLTLRHRPSQPLIQARLMCYSMAFDITPLFVLYPKLPPGTFLSPKAAEFSDLISPESAFTEFLNKLNDRGTEDNLNAIFQQITFAAASNTVLEELEAGNEAPSLTQVIYGQRGFFSSKLTSCLVSTQSLLFKILLPLQWLLSPLGRWASLVYLASNTRFRINKKVNSIKKQQRLLAETQSFKDIKFEQNQERLLVFHASALRRWLLLNLYAYNFVLDWLLGIAFLAFLFYFQTEVLAQLHKIFGASLHISKLRQLIEWLVERLPVDFKLNASLDQAVGTFIKSILDAWQGSVTTELTTLEHVILIAVGGLGLLGFQLQLAVIHDILVFCSLHVYLIYRVMAGFYHFTLEMEQTLLRLFRGKKYNVVKQREDSHAFGVDAFVLGMLLFAMFTFLLPTLAIYYACFFLIYLRVFLTEVLLLHFQTLAITFPLYLFHFLHSQPYAVPCAVEMRATDVQGVLKIKPIAQTAQGFFAKTSHKLSKLWKHCSPGQVIVSALSGRGIPFLMESLERH